ncbi:MULTISPECIES: electron transport complex subunit RsxD [Gammaproteobacteria]|uniref:electron transport complex subunit RsxD n=1 Tax=Gammaproteobacteria TaxID=1236 RepID=UPI000DD0391A|nr:MULTISPECIES: electron transport complex subunit RsxD [Gammaproteobacteria]RTE87592.1 electron transport complex subunit RsxD [Aliidiomarina sp. B3213]TCZ92624.1 electron transport complex subunit RsxD [Lysobacter sp. N42]
MSFFIASSPHNHVRRNTQWVMQQVLLAMVPGVLAQVWIFGWGVLIQLAFAIVTAIVAESLFLAFRDKPIKPALRDNTAILTAALLAVSIPPLAPWWVIFIGVIFSIVVVKQVFGGVGQNIFNPAMAGYVLLLVSFPVQMTQWMPPAHLATFNLSFIDSLWLFFTQYTTDGFSVMQVTMVQLGQGIDAVSMATPLDHIRNQLSQGYTLSESLNSPIFGGLAGLGWQEVNMAYFLGGAYLVARRVITWHIPVALLGTLLVASGLGTTFAIDQLPGVNIHLLSGATMLGAFFIATDPVSAATSNKGKVIYAALIGVLVYVIRTWGGYPDAMAFAVLLANLCVPTIDYFSKPRPYGNVKAKESAE